MLNESLYFQSWVTTGLRSILKEIVTSLYCKVKLGKRLDDFLLFILNSDLYLQLYTQRYTFKYKQQRAVSARN